MKIPLPPFLKTPRISAISCHVIVGVLSRAKCTADSSPTLVLIWVGVITNFSSLSLFLTGSSLYSAPSASLGRFQPGFPIHARALCCSLRPGESGTGWAAAPWRCAPSSRSPPGARVDLCVMLAQGGRTVPGVPPATLRGSLREEGKKGGVPGFWGWWRQLRQGPASLSSPRGWAHVGTPQGRAGLSAPLAAAPRSRAPPLRVPPIS